MTDPSLARFLTHIEISSDLCWNWRGHNKDGYIAFRLGRGIPMAAAHRVAYEHWVGVIPSGLELDHLCSNKNCVNPDHLEAVSRSENLRRGYVRVQALNFIRSPF